MATPNRGLPQMAGSDLASTIDDTFDAAMAILDGATVLTKAVFSSRPDPATAKSGALFQPTDIPGFLYLSDGTNWIEVSPGMGSAPVGSSMEWWSSSDPGDTRWIVMDGRALSAATYPALYAMLGNSYDTFRGALAPGAGLFRIPNAAGLTIVGAGSGNGLTNRTLGSSGGEESHQLATAELPAHSHPLGGVATLGATGGGTFYEQIATNDTTKKHPYWDIGTQTTNVSATQNTGSGSAHNNMPPFVVANRILRVS